MKPLCIELFAGTFGWSQGWHELGGYTIGFDIDHQPYHGPVPKGDDLVLQDVLTLHGSQFKDASLILASSPCQAYSYMAMPWSRSKQIARAFRGEDVFPDGYEGYRTIAELNALFEAPRRIQREASAAAGRYIPMIQENVRGAIPWVGRSAWNFGSYHLWGDVPALMPMTLRGVMKKGVTHRGNGETNFHASAERAEGQKNPGFRFDGSGKSFQTESVKNEGGSWFNIAHNTTSGKGRNPVTKADGIKNGGRLFPNDCADLAAKVEALSGMNPEAGTKGYAARLGESTISRKYGSKSSARKAASARIARIPLTLSRHIAQVYYPKEVPSPAAAPPEVKP